MSDAQIKLALSEILARMATLMEMLDDAEPVETSDIPKIPFKDNKEFEIPEEWLNDWYCRYGELLVRKELLKCRNWCLDNPEKQKYSGKGKRPRAFLGSWLNRAAERSGVFVAKATDNKKYARKVN